MVAVDSGVASTSSGSVVEGGVGVGRMGSKWPSTSAENISPTPLK